jgi:hypothetical protein
VTLRRRADFGLSRLIDDTQKDLIRNLLRRTLVVELTLLHANEETNQRMGKRFAAALREHWRRINKPTKIALGVIAGSVVAGTTGFFAAPVIATCLGSLGVLGTTATTGVTISSLSGAALTNASLAALGGGAIAAEGFGIAGGTAAIVSVSTSLGGAATGAGLLRAKD